MKKIACLALVALLAAPVTMSTANAAVSGASRGGGGGGAARGGGGGGAAQGVPGAVRAAALLAGADLNAVVFAAVFSLDRGSTIRSGRITAMAILIPTRTVTPTPITIPTMIRIIMGRRRRALPIYRQPMSAGRRRISPGIIATIPPAITLMSNSAISNGSKCRRALRALRRPGTHVLADDEPMRALRQG